MSKGFMQFWYGFVGALLGALLGLAVAVLIVAIASVGDDLGGVFLIVFVGPIGLILGTVLGAILALRVFLLADGDTEANREPSKKMRLVASLVIGALLLAAAMFWGAERLRQPPSDDQLLRNFDWHRSTFDQLARMARADKKLHRVDETWTDPDNTETVGVSKARIADYRRLQSEAGVPRGFESTDAADEIDFNYRMTGSALSSETDKGYAYLSQPPARVLRSLDSCPSDGPNRTMSYRHIQGNWYLFFEYTPE